MARLRDYSITFAGAGEREFQAEGRYIRILETPAGDVFFTIDGSGEYKRGAGQQIAAVDGFRRIRVRSTVAQTVLFTVADEPQDDNRSNVALSVNATVAPGAILDNGGDVSVPGTSAADVMAGDPDTLSVTVTSLETNDPSAPLRVGTAGVGATSGHPLWPGDSITMATNATVRVYNPHSAAQTVAVMRLAK